MIEQTLECIKDELIKIRLILERNNNRITWPPYYGYSPNSCKLDYKITSCENTAVDPWQLWPTQTTVTNLGKENI